MSDQKEVKFVGGLIVKAPREGAPDFVKMCLSFKRLEAIAWLQEQEGEWVNADVKEARSGKLYAAVDDWKPTPRQDAPAPRQQAPAQSFEQDEEIPFDSRA